jgi:hypothetical protein
VRRAGPGLLHGTALKIGAVTRPPKIAAAWPPKIGTAAARPPKIGTTSRK